MYLAVFILSVLAVPGVYYLFTVILSAFSDAEAYSLLVSGDGYSKEELLLRVGSASMYLEGRRGMKPTPILLFSEMPSHEIQAFLTDYGISFCMLFPPSNFLDL